MCGIAAIIAQSGDNKCLSDIGSLVLRLKHRGDRPVATKLFANAALGCARLAIVDPVGGEQPMVAGSLAVVFNGEIYNHAQLRTEMRAAGICFRTESDTEVLLHGYALWGDTLPKHLEGMYAFLIFDHASGDFFAARDPFGIKPLYSAHNGNAWYFSSEIYPLVACGLGDVTPVPPGGFVLNGRTTDNMRTETRPINRPAVNSVDEAVDLFGKALSESVQRHMPPGDLPVAVFCSGGIDSSALLFESVQACKAYGWNPKHKLRVYSVGTESSEDPPIAAELASKLEVPFSFVKIAPDEMLNSIPNTVATIESFEPNHIRAGTTSLALAERVARDGFKVALLGEGADEQLGGYEEFPDLLSRGSIKDVEELLGIFTRQLHRTQLRRVDRTTMAYGLEARVPFLDDRLADLIRRISAEYKVFRGSNGRIVGKHVLREAYRGRLPDFIVDRRKVPMGEGAGVGDNRPAGFFFENAMHKLTDRAFRQLADKYPHFNLRNREEAYYFSLFLERFGALKLAVDRPRTNLLATT